MWWIAKKTSCIPNRKLGKCSIMSISESSIYVEEKRQAFIFQSWMGSEIVSLPTGGHAHPLGELGDLQLLADLGDKNHSLSIDPTIRHHGWPRAMNCSIGWKYVDSSHHQMDVLKKNYSQSYMGLPDTTSKEKENCCGHFGSLLVF